MSSLANISVRFRADLKQFSSEMQNATRTLKKQGKQFQKVGQNMSTYISAPLALIGGMAVKTFADFEQALAQVEAVSGATGEQMQNLKQNAEDLGASTRFAASEVAGLQLNFSKLGLSPDEILNATEATLALAQASGEDLAMSATVAASTLKGFGLEATESTRVTDVMADSFSSSALDLTKFQVAMSTVAPVAKTAGQSIESTTGLLAVLVNAGVDASTAGTGLRNIFLDLAASGMTMEEAFAEINESTNKNKTAMDLFGKRGATVATVLAENAEAAQSFTKQFENAEGSAKRMAKIMDNTLQGSFKRLQSALESAFIAIGENLAPVVQELSDFVADLASKFKDLTPTTQRIIIVIGAMVAAIGPLLVALGFMMTTVIPGLITAFASLTAVMAANPFGLIAVGVAAAVSAFIAYNSVMGKTNKLQEQSISLRQQAAQSIAVEKAKVEELLFIARDENVSKSERLKAIRELNKISPEYLGNLKLETINTDEAKASVQEYNKALEKNALIKAAQQELQKLEEKRIQKELELSKRRKSIQDQENEAYKSRSANAQLAALTENQLTQAKKLLVIEQDNLNKTYEEEKQLLLDILGLKDKTSGNSLSGGDSTTFKGDQGTTPQTQSVSTLQSGGIISPLNGIAEQMETQNIEIEGQMTKFNETMLRFKENMNMIIEQAVENFAVGFGQLIASFGQGQSAFAGLAGLMLATVGDMAIRLGKLAIQTGTVVEALKKSLQSLNGFVAIAAGVALIALGSVVKKASANIAQNAGSGVTAFADGGIVSGPTMGLMGEYAGARNNPEVIAPLDKLKSMMSDAGGGTQKIIVEGKVKGQDLLFTNARAQNYRDRRG